MLMKWLRRLVIGAMAILIIGCLGQAYKPFNYVGSPEPYSVIPHRIYKIWIDKNFTANDKIAIAYSVTQWNFALNGIIRLDIVSYDFDMEPAIINRAAGGEGWVIYKIDSDNPIIHDEPPNRTLAFVNRVGGSHMWIIRNRLNKSWVSGVVLHEIGHLLGAEHDRVYLMQPTFHWETYRCVDYEAARLVAEYQHIPIRHINYCSYVEATTLPN